VSRSPIGRLPQIGLVATIIPLLIWGWIALFNLAERCGVPWYMAWIPSVATSGVMLASTTLSLQPGLDRSIHRYAGGLAVGGILGDILAAGTEEYLQAAAIQPPALLAVPVGGIPCLMGGLLIHAVAMTFTQRRREDAEAEAAEVERQRQEQARIDAQAAQDAADARTAKANREALVSQQERTAEAKRTADELARRATAERALTDAVAHRAEVARKALAPTTTTAGPHLVVDNTRRKAPAPRTASPVRDKALAYLRQQAADGVDLAKIGPKALATAIDASPDTCKKGLPQWRAIIAELMEAAG
jgi:hypothetical protein